MLDALKTHRSELARALRNFHFERREDGALWFPTQGLVASGRFRHWLNGADEQIDANVVVYTGLDYILNAAFAQASQITAFYIPPFSGNVSPPPDLTAATFGSTMTEFTHYTEALRPVWAKDAIASHSIGNSTTPARFTSDATGGNVWGAALVSASAKGAGSGLLVCCAKFASIRTLTGIGDKLDIEYVITAADGSA